MPRQLTERERKIADVMNEIVGELTGWREVYTTEHMLDYFGIYHGAPEGAVELEVDEGHPKMLCVPGGNYRLLGSAYPDFRPNDFWRLLAERLDFDEVVPYRSKGERTPIGPTGPRLRLRLKGEVR